MKIDPSSKAYQETYKLLNGSVVPRPIAWVSTVGADGVFNVAPFSFFMPICAEPPTLCFSIGRRNGELKDTIRNIQATGDFVVNMVNEELAEAMNISCGDYPADVDEFQVANLTPVASEKVKSPRVGEAPVSMECRLVQVIDFGTGLNIHSLTFGEIVQFHVKDELLYDGKIDVVKYQPLGRLSGESYSRVTRAIFDMKRPRV